MWRPWCINKQWFCTICFETVSSSKLSDSFSEVNIIPDMNISAPLGKNPKVKKKFVKDMQQKNENQIDMLIIMKN